MPLTDPPVPTCTPVTYDSSFVFGRKHLNQDFTITRARTFQATCFVTVGAVAQNLTGGTLNLTARWSVGGDTVFTCSSPSDGITITSPSTGEFTITISASKTTSLPIQSGVIYLPYEVTFTSAAAEVYPILYGKISVRPNIV